MAISLWSLDLPLLEDRRLQALRKTTEKKLIRKWNGYGHFVVESFSKVLKIEWMQKKKI